MRARAATRLSRRAMAFAIAVLLLAAVTAQAQSQALSVSAASGPAFPARTLVLTAPGSALSASQVHVLENGRPVGGLVVRPLSEAHHGDYGVILAIDTSASMSGGRIAQAMTAARALAAGLSADQEIGVVEFNQRARVVLALTADTKAIDRALAVTPATGGATHIFDAAALAERELVAAKVAVGAVIVVSAGDDHGSRLDAGRAAAIGRSAHYGIFSVAMLHPSFGGEDLAELAVAGGGTFVSAEPSQLHRTLLALQARLTKHYVLHYRSLEGLGARVHVTVSVDGVPGSASLGYTAPAPPPAPRHPTQPFWTSTVALVSVSVAAALLLAIALAFLVAPRLRPETVQARIARFTDSAPPAIVAAPPEPVRRGLVEQIEEALEDSPRWQRLREELEIAGIGLTPLRLVVLTATATIAVATIVAIASGIAPLSLPVLALGPVVAREIVRQRLKRQRRAFRDNLAAHLQEVASAMRAGHSIISALAVTSDGAGEPGRDEFRRVIADEQLGKPLNVALAPMARRMQSPDIAQLALIASVHDRSGGNMAEVLDRLAAAVRERSDLQRELHSLTAQARLSRYIVTALPPTVLGLFAIINPGYTNPLFHTTAGVVLLIVGTAMVACAFFVMRKIVEIEA